ncbi:MAG TPA: cysteine desulfurase family protein [Patescibacteria group bacterium]|nr:cysteine desulfurase family protein [Patescibacteria group bacterium]
MIHGTNMSRQSKKIIYLDHAATTPLDERVLEAMEPYLKEEYGNPSAPYTLGHRTRKAVDDARACVARILNCSSQEVVFTSGGTESDNLAILGIARNRKFGHIITSTIEHPAVIEPCQVLKQEGFTLSVISVEKNGRVNPESIAQQVTNETILVSIMFANNEIGTIQPIAKLVHAVKEKNPQVVFHTDACQAAGAQPLNVQQLGVDLLTINASKIYGPKGVGALYIKYGTKLQPLFFGGGQEYSVRPGTENVAGIVGFAKAIEIAEQEREQESKRLIILRDQLTQGILQRIPNTKLNGDIAERLPNNVNILIKGIDGEVLLFLLDQEGICASLGSACTAGSVEPSSVLLALGLSQEESRQSVRFTLGRSTTEQEINAVLGALPRIIQKIRK